LKAEAETTPSLPLRRLSRYANFSSEERSWLADSLSGRQVLATRSEINVASKQPPRALIALLDGFACRVQAVGNGRRQITAFLLPGDICDFRFLVSEPAETGIVSLQPTTVAVVDQERIVSLCERFPRITRALLRASAVDEAIARQWLTSIGQRSAIERTAHLFCELLMRMRAVGLARDLSYDLPATQAELGDALGLSAIHMNRTIQQLRRQNVISYSRGRVTVLDPPRLAQMALFDQSYLRIGATLH
jgi:CRP-like cAMP-binding protein